MTIKIGILGNKGRMGQTLMALAKATKGVTLVGGVDKGDDIAAFIKKCDAVIDFTSPEATLAFAAETAKQKKIHVIGTTGFTEAQLKKLKEFAKKTVVFWSPNMSIGVNLVTLLTQKAAEILDDSYDIEVLEMHHRYKKDAPSGTALLLGEAAAKGRKIDLRKKSDRVRDGITGERKKGNIGFATLRGGSVIGDHTVMFASDHDRVELTHKSSSRDIYASGAIKATGWCKGRKPGFYSMSDILKF